jgi:hypothetical protein
MSKDTSTMKRSTGRTRLLWVTGTVSVVALVVLALLSFRGATPHESQEALSQESQLRQRVDADSEVYREQLMTSLAVVDPRRVLGAMTAERDLKAHYQRYFRYPHNSRPLNDDMQSLLDPLRIQTSPSPVYKRPPRTPLERPQYYVQFFAPRHSVTGNESFTATLRVEDANSHVLITPTIEKAVVLSDVKTGRIELAEIEPSTVEDRGERLQAFAWSAPGATRLYWGELQLYVELDIQGVKSVQVLPFSSTPKAPARFTGVFSEELVSGSLVVKAEVTTSEPGTYVFEGNLFHQASGAPVSWSRNVVTLAAGTQTIEYLFFGRIFHDKKLGGRFLLRHLRGYRLNRPYDPGQMIDAAEFVAQQGEQTAEQKARVLEIADEPLHQFVAVWPEDYLTGNYELAEFSTNEYEGEDKTRTLAAIIANEGETYDEQ